MDDVAAHLRRVERVFHMMELIQHQDQLGFVLISGCVWMEEFKGGSLGQTQTMQT